MYQDDLKSLGGVRVIYVDSWKSCILWSLTEPEEEFLFKCLQLAVDTLCAWQLQVMIGDAGQTLRHIVIFRRLALFRRVP